MVDGRILGRVVARAPPPSVARRRSAKLGGRHPTRSPDARQDLHEPRTSDPVATRRARRRCWAPPTSVGRSMRPPSGSIARAGCGSWAPAPACTRRSSVPSLIQLSGRQAHAVPAMQFVDFAPLVGPQDGVVVITHTAETAFALSTRAQAFTAGLGPVMITKRGSGFPDAIETVDKETSDTYTVSYTTAVLALAMLAKELGAEQLDDATLGARPGGRGRGDRRPGGRRDPPAGAAARARGRRSERRHRPGGRAQGAGGVALPRRGLRRGVPAARLGGARSTPATGWWRCSHPDPERLGRGGRACRRGRAGPGHASGRAGGSAHRARAAPAHGPAAAPGAPVRAWSGPRTPTPSSWARGTTRRPGRSAPRSRIATARLRPDELPDGGQFALARPAPAPRSPRRRARSPGPRPRGRAGP